MKESVISLRYELYLRHRHIVDLAERLNPEDNPYLRAKFQEIEKDFVSAARKSMRSERRGR